MSEKPKVVKVTTVYPLLVDLLYDTGRTEQVTAYIDVSKGKVIIPDHHWEEELKWDIIKWMDGKGVTDELPDSLVDEIRQLRGITNQFEEDVKKEIHD